jgi:phosphohistidine phosphatase
MKTLLLLRHAKSDWGDSSLRDFDRPLATRGEKDAPRIGKALHKRGPLPDFIMSSPAARAKATIEAVAAAAKIDLPIQFDEKIYGATSAELMTVVRRLPNDSSCALLVGHNPGFEDLARRLSGMDERMPTAALACINFDVAGWEDVEDERGEVAWLITPKNLDD